MKRLNAILSTLAVLTIGAHNSVAMMNFTRTSSLPVFIHQFKNNKAFSSQIRQLAGLSKSLEQRKSVQKNISKNILIKSVVPEKRLFCAKSSEAQKICTDKNSLWWPRLKLNLITAVSWVGLELNAINHLIKPCDQKNINLLAQAAAQNIIKINRWTTWTLSEIAQGCDQEHANILAKAAAQGITEVGYSGLYKLLKGCDQEHINILAKAAAHNITKVRYSVLLEIINRCDQEHINVLAKAAAHNITKIDESLLREIIERTNQEHIDLFAQAAASNLVKTKEYTLKEIEKRCSQKYINLFEQLYLQKNILKEKLLKLLKKEQEEKTNTQAHFQQNTFSEWTLEYLIHGVGAIARRFIFF